MGEVFLGSEAIAASALTEYQLRRWYRPLFRDVYVPKRVEPSLDDRILGAWLWSRRKAVVAGVAASALHGAQWVDPATPIELIAKNGRPQGGLVVRNQTIGADEMTHVNGLVVTTVARTAFDLCRQLPTRSAVARLDALMRAAPFSIKTVNVLAKRYRGARGVRKLNTVLPLVDGGAASPRETYLRLLLIAAGLPAPATQISVHDGLRLVAILDMGWEDYLVAMEYDGDQHRTDRRQFVKDINRHADIGDLGWIVIRVVCEHQPRDIVERVYRALHRRGYRRDRR
jgi:hypothetical protein